MLRKHQAVWFATTLLIASTHAAAGLSAQDLGTIPEVQYEAGGIKSQYLPYGRRWAITGSTSTSRGVADVVIGRIKIHSSAPFADDPAQCWVRPRNDLGQPDRNIKTFRVNFDRNEDRLILGAGYDLRLEFFSEGVGRLLIRGIVDGAYRGAVAAARRDRAINSTQLLALVNAEVQRQLTPLMSTANATVVHLRTDSIEGRCQTDTTVPTARLDATQDRLLQSAVIDQVIAERQDSVIETIAAAIEAIDRGDEFVERLTSAVERNKNGPLTASDVSAILSAMSRSSAPDLTVVQRLATAAGRDYCPNKLPPLSRSDCQALENLSRLFRRYLVADASRPNADSIRNARQNVQVILEDAYQVVTRAALTTYSYDNTVATADKLRIGTVYGFGGAWLSPGHGNSGDAFALVGIKLYRWPVDKSLPDPYFGRRSARMSMVVGILSNSTLRYRDQDQLHLAGQVTPLVGIATDVSRDVTLQAGVVAFRQPTISPLSAGSPVTGTPKLAPYLSLGFDFDAANRLKTLLTK